MKKFKLLLVLLVAILCLGLVACGSKESGKDEGQEGQEQGNEPGETSSLKRDVAASEAGLTNILGSGNLFVTTFGQADFAYLTEIVDEAVGTSVTYTSNKTLQATDVAEGDVVIAVLGYTSKGISGDITQTSEAARAEAFANKTGIKLVLVQLSGKDRRGESSDPIIEKAVKGAYITLIYDANDGKGADYDNQYSNVWCKDKTLFAFSDEWNINEYIKILVGAN